MAGIAATVARRSLHDQDPDVAWWLKRPAEERIAHVDELRAEYYGWDDETGPRLQRVHRIVQRP